MEEVQVILKFVILIINICYHIGVYSSISKGVSSSYYESFNHHVVLDVLVDNTDYYYIVGDESGGWSSEMSFRSAPLTSNLRGNFSFAVFGDLGVYNGLPSTDYLIRNKDELSFVWHGGDISYADDSFLHPVCI
jgi:acid phosphatase